MCIPCQHFAASRVLNATSNNSTGPSNSRLKQPAKAVTALASLAGVRGTGRKANPRVDRGSATSSGSHNV
jgi:hypothetical protein